MGFAVAFAPAPSDFPKEQGVLLAGAGTRRCIFGLSGHKRKIALDKTHHGDLLRGIRKKISDLTEWITKLSKDAGSLRSRRLCLTRGSVRLVLWNVKCYIADLADIKNYFRDKSEFSCNIDI